MPFIIIHGEHQPQVHQKLAEVIAQAQQASHQLTRFDPKQHPLTELETTLGTESLFAQPRTIIIEAMHSLPKSKKKDQLLTTLKAFTPSQDLTLVLLERKILTVTQLKGFPSAQVFGYKLPTSLWQWLDTVTSRQSPSKKIQLLRTAMAQESADFCFLMLVRQVRTLRNLMLQIPQKISPFEHKKLLGLQKHWTIAQLNQLTDQLVHLDWQHKTGQLPVSFSTRLEQLMVE